MRINIQKQVEDAICKAITELHQHLVPVGAIVIPQAYAKYVPKKMGIQLTEHSDEACVKTMPPYTSLKVKIQLPQLNQ